ncbi:MAG TPA: FAD-linked oxidase C-terminal domain-containing protein [Solirubrobacteraceae bacterium]|nr:FAD-linked oxidase C-terminal domain-containing protein [Solirubrobacteraceae bacterium]
MATTASTSLERDLTALLGDGAVLPGNTRAYLADATESRNLRGRADAIVIPPDAEAVAKAVAWCYDHDVAIIPRGGGTGFTGGAVPLDGGVVLSLERLTKVRHLDPGLWRAAVEAGMVTADLRRRARENGLLYPPDPGSHEQSQIGGNIATNAGGPHAFKYGVTGAWVTGLEFVLAPGELVRVGGPIRKDVAGYDLKSLMIGSEGTLGVVTAAWVKMIPAPEAALPLAALYPDTETGCAAIEAVFASGVVPAAIEYLDEGSIEATRGAFPAELPGDARFMVIVDADGTETEAAHIHAELNEVLTEDALLVHAPTDLKEINALWRWRDGASIAVTAQRGGKVSEDIVVPVDRLQEAIDRTIEIGRRHDLPACSWGHAGDGNLHSTFMIDLDDPAELERAEHAAEDLFALAVELGGSVSGEHGIGLVKNGQLAHQWAPVAVAMHEAIKRAFDPKGLLNPGKKLGNPPPRRVQLQT